MERLKKLFAYKSEKVDDFMFADFTLFDWAFIAGIALFAIALVWAKEGRPNLIQMFF